jgi:hypothetical protein
MKMIAPKKTEQKEGNKEIDSSPDSQLCSWLKIDLGLLPLFLCIIQSSRVFPVIQLQAL